MNKYKNCHDKNRSLYIFICPEQTSISPIDFLDYQFISTSLATHKYGESIVIVIHDDTEVSTEEQRILIRIS